ncbi:hypothetical protein GCM10011384_23150 [Psychrobacillus lasiicapitis]|nr:hypothetical protein GCM10011384_23150 [Psychrobacillus lasiicapitis]
MIKPAIDRVHPVMLKKHFMRMLSLDPFLCENWVLGIISVLVVKKYT